MARAISASTLDDLVPLHQLDKDQRIRLASSGQVAPIPSGKKLTAVQEDPWIDYLLSGRICLVGADGKEIIESGTMRACRPVFDEQRLREHAIFLTDGELLRLDRQLYAHLRALDLPSFDTLKLNDTEGDLFDKLYQAGKQGTLSLPTLPKVAKAIQDAMKDPNTTSAKLARIVQMDMAVTGGLIRLANSVMYRAVQPIPDVRNAIIRLGMDVTRSAVISMAMSQLFRASSPLMKHRMKAAWNRSVHISALSYVIARHCDGFSPEQAMLAGLVHTVGVIPILDHVSRNRIAVDEDELEAAIIKLHVMVGELVVGYWGLGPEIAQVVRESGNWYRDGADAPDYCDIVLLARLYRLNQSESRGPLPRFDEVPAFYKLGLGDPGASDQVDILAEAGEELSVLMAMLRG